MKEYLGDSVYAQLTNFGIILTTENGGPKPSNEIILEPQVAFAVINFLIKNQVVSFSEIYAQNYHLL